MASIILKRKSLKDSEKATRRIIEGKIRDSKHKLADDDDEVEVETEPQAQVPGLTPEEITALIELIPYKDALIKIAKGEFEIEKIVEEDEEVEEAEEETVEDFEEDEEGTEIEEDDEFSEDDDFEEYDEVEDDEDEEVEEDALEDSNEINDAWKKRLCGQQD